VLQRFWFLYRSDLLRAYIVGCLVIAIARGNVHDRPTGQGGALKSIGYGVLGHIFAPFAGLVLLALCLTAPIAMLVFLAWTGLFYLAKLVTALTVTDWLMRRAGFHPSPYLALLLGMIALWIFFMVPFLGVLLYWFFVPIFGIGATLVGVRERWNSRHVAAPPQDPAAAQALG
jgi:hypothetical protein